MKVEAMLQQLRIDRQRINLAIEELTKIQDSRDGCEQKFLKKRGRKSMSKPERLEVSERMRKYWAHRRESRAMASGA